MFEFFLYDSRKRVKGSLYLSLGMAVFVAMIVWIYPSFAESFEEDELLEAYPEQLLQIFDIETMQSLEGFLAFELYAFGWIILLALYFAYLAAGIIAEDVDRGRMDSILALPVSRSRLLVERFGALSVPIVVVNVLLPPVVVAGGWLIDESLPVVDVVAVHLLSIPYLFACAGIGLVFSVAFDRADIARRSAIGLTFFLFLLESLVQGTDYEIVGAIAPMRYFSPNEILLESTYDLLGVAVLVAMTVGLVVLSRAIFTNKDI